MGLHRIAQIGRVYRLKHGAIIATRTAGNHNPPPVSSIVPYTSYPLTFTIDTPPLHDSTEYVILCTVERGKGKARCKYLPDRQKRGKEMSEAIKANNAVLRTGVIITGVYLGFALVGACYLVAIM